MQEPDEPIEDDHDNEADSCVCGLEITPSEFVSDAQLPLTSGGVQELIAQPEHEDQIDGCDVNFNDGPPTEDKDLPAASGGVLQPSSG